MRLPTHDQIMVWKFKNFEKNNEVMNLKPDFVIVVSYAHLKVKAVLNGLGITWLPKAMVESAIGNGELITILGNWDMRYSRYYCTIQAVVNLRPFFVYWLTAYIYQIFKNQQKNKEAYHLPIHNSKPEQTVADLSEYLLRE